MRFLALGSIGLAAALVNTAHADDLSGVEKFLCSAGTASACCEDGKCASGTAWELDIPQFVEVDLSAKRISTTKASKQNRTTTIESLKRVDGQIFIHGNQGDRGFSFTIDESTGELTAAIAASGCVISVFGACTPLPSAK